MVSPGLQRRQPALPARTTCPRHDLDLRILTSRCAGLRQCTMRAGCHKCSVELPVGSGGGQRGQRCEGSLFRAHEGAATQPPTQICRAAPAPPSYPGPEPDHRSKGEVWGQGTEPGSSSAGGGTVHVCDLTPYLWSREPSLEVCFQVGKLRLGALERLASAARGGGPEKDREAQNLQQEHNTSDGGEDHGGHFCLCWKTRPHVFLMGAVPEVGQVMGRTWALDQAHILALCGPGQAVSPLCA